MYLYYALLHYYSYCCIKFSYIISCFSSGTIDSIHGPTKNIWGSEIPYFLKERGSTLIEDGSKETVCDRIAGGSSGGSAVAVASGVCFAWVLV